MGFISSLLELGFFWLPPLTLSRYLDNSSIWINLNCSMSHLAYICWSFLTKTILKWSRLECSYHSMKYYSRFKISNPYYNM